MNQFNSIAVIGLGYVGLPLALRFAQENYRVVGIDIDPQKIALLNNGVSYIKHIGDQAIRHALQRNFIACDDFSILTQADAIIICVPTPLSPTRDPDLSFIINTMQSIIPFLHKGQLISLESTTWPGTTEEVLRPMIEKQGWKIGDEIFLVFSPEREDPGNMQFNTKTIPKLIGGSTSACLTAGIKLYQGAIDTLVPVSSTRAAEMAKLLENIHRAVNIGLVNEMKMICDRMDLDIHEIIRAASTKPFGFVPYTPGPGLGGHCIPIDPFYLTWKAREYGMHTRFIELAGDVNSAMPLWVVQKVSDALNRAKKSINGSRILVLGISYKKNIDDMRESPSVELMSMLQERGAQINYSDPWVPNFPKMRRYSFGLSSLELTAQTLSDQDLVLIATNHDAFDYDLIRQHAAIIVDTRGVYQQAFANVVRA